VPRTESSNPVRWVEQSAKSNYKPIVLDPSTAVKIFEALSGAERALAILVAATGIRISEARGLKWEDNQPSAFPTGMWFKIILPREMH
jgi:integrase